MRFRVRWQSGLRTGRNAPTAPLVLRTRVSSAANETWAEFDTMLHESRGERALEIRHDRAYVTIELGRLRTDGRLTSLAQTPAIASIPQAESAREDIRIFHLSETGSAPDFGVTRNARPPEKHSSAALPVTVWRTRRTGHIFAPAAHKIFHGTAAASGAGRNGPGSGLPLLIRRRTGNGAAP